MRIVYYRMTCNHWSYTYEPYGGTATQVTKNRAYCWRCDAIQSLDHWTYTRPDGVTID